jgi:hypothetical protein
MLAASSKGPLRPDDAAVLAEAEPAIYSNAKMCFQSFFMLITTQPLVFASSISD